jgi:glycosyltransferase involved in cell wall biosynthesis
MPRVDVSQRQMRILLVLDEVNCGGAELSFFALCGALASRCAVHLALSRLSLENSTIKAMAESAENAGVIVHACRARLYPGTAANLHRWLRRSAARELARLVQDVRPEVVVVNLPTVERGQAALDAAELVDPRLAVWGFLHLSQKPSTLGAKLGKLRDLLVPGLLRRFRGLMAVSAAGARDAVSEYRVVTPAVLHPPTAAVRPAVSLADRPARRRAEGLPDIFLLGMVARVQIHHKGHDAALRLTRRLLDCGLSMHLVVIGDGPDLPAVRQLCEELQLGASVTFMGWRQDASELIPLLSAAVMPSRYEGMPLAALQAAVAHVPVIGYAVDGLAELLPPEFVVVAGDEIRLAEAVIKLMHGSIHWPAEELSRRASEWSDPAKAAECLLKIVTAPSSAGVHPSGSARLAENAEGTEEVLPG